MRRRFGHMALAAGLLLSLGACTNEPPRPDGTVTFSARSADSVPYITTSPLGFTLLSPCAGQQIMELTTPGRTRNLRAVIALDQNTADLMSLNVHGSFVGHDTVVGTYEGTGTVKRTRDFHPWEQLRIEMDINGKDSATLTAAKLVIDGRFYKIDSYGPGGRVDCPAPA